MNWLILHTEDVLRLDQFGDQAIEKQSTIINQ